MRTIQRTYTLYTLAELSPRARSQAYDDWLRRPPEYVFAADNNKTLEAFCDLFGVQCRDWHYDASRHGFRFDTDYSDQELNLSGVRLLSLLPAQNLLVAGRTEKAPQPHLHAHQLSAYGFLGG